MTSSFTAQPIGNVMKFGLPVEPLPYSIKPITICIQAIFISIRTSCCTRTPDPVHQLMIKVLITLNAVMRVYLLLR